MEIARGATRTVLLTKRWAIKFPSFYSWYFFLLGLTCNIKEKEWWEGMNHDVRLCPVSFYFWSGLFIVMPRAETVVAADLPDISELSGLPTDYKTENFGRLGDRIVMIDYGS